MLNLLLKLERDVKKRMSISWLGSNCGSGVLTFLIELVATPCICIIILFRLGNSIDSQKKRLGNSIYAIARTVSIAQDRSNCGGGAMIER